MEAIPSKSELDALLARAVSPGAGSAAVLIASSDGELTAEIALGTTRRWDAPGVPTSLPSRPVSMETRFDLASITKPLVAAALLSELESQGGEPALAAAEFLPEFRVRELRRITIADLLSHTAGFQSTWPDHAPDYGAARFRLGARPEREPGEAHRYSCLSFIWAGLLAQDLSGSTLDELVRRRVFDPLEMRNTGYLPVAAERMQLAATEYMPDRGMIQGVVHDETAFALGGVSGNAGVFGSAPDLLKFAEAIRTGEGLSPRVRNWLVEPIGFRFRSESGYLPTLGLRKDETWCAASPGSTVSHTGFTGTAFLTEPGGEQSLVLLTNRVHPSREQTILPSLRAPIVAAATTET